MSTLQSLPIVKISTERNVRDKVVDLGELTASIKAHGVLQPITVRPGDAGDYVVLWGHRRLAAALLAGLTEIPAIVRVDLDVVDRASVQLIENLLREDLSPLEEAAGYRRLIDLGLSQAGVAAKVGRSQPHVSKRLALLALPKKLREQVDSGGITIEAALEPKREKRAPKAKAVLKEVSRRINEATSAVITPDAVSATFEKHPGQEVRNLVVDLLALAERASELTCASCGVTLFGTAEELRAIEHKSRCAYRRARRYLAETAPDAPTVASVFETEAVAVEAPPAAQPVSQHACRSCGGREGPWAEMVDVGWLCVNCDAAAPVAAKVEKAGPIDQRVRV